MSIVLWIILGAIAGWIASAITSSNTGILGDIIIGIVGALLGGFLMNLFGGQNVTGLNLYSILVAILGSIILIWLFRAVRGGTRGTV